MILRLHGLAVLVQADEGTVEAEAGEIEVVEVATEKRDRELRREYQAYIAVLAVLVEFVLATLVERDHLTAAGRITLAGLIRDLGSGRIAQLDRILRISRSDRALHPCRDVGDLLQDLGLHSGALPLLGARVREETLRDVVLLRGRHGLLTRDHAMMIGEHQTVLRDHRGGATARQAH